MSRPAHFGTVLGALLDTGSPSVDPEHVEDAFRAILAGAWTPVQVGAFATALRLRGETAEALTAAARATREAMAPVHHELSRVLDTCGTGGDGAHTLNLSSAAAILVAACGFAVAKHGNRSSSSRCGSADVFEAMGIPLDVPTDRQAGILRETGFAFLFAQAHHPALRHAAQARKELATRTIFNALGPLVNPALPTHQLIGVYDDATRERVARALGALGITRAWVVHSLDGLDELSPSGPTRVSEVADGGRVRQFIVTPEDFALDRIDRSALQGGDPAWNARALNAIFDGEPHPARNAVVLNAAAAIAVATGEPLAECAVRARGALTEGLARRTFDRWKAAAMSARDLGASGNPGV